MWLGLQLTKAENITPLMLPLKRRNLWTVRFGECDLHRNDHREQFQMFKRRTGWTISAGATVWKRPARGDAGWPRVFLRVAGLPWSEQERPSPSRDQATRRHRLTTCHWRPVTRTPQTIAGHILPGCRVVVGPKLPAIGSISARYHRAGSYLRDAGPVAADMHRTATVNAAEPHGGGWGCNCNC